MKSAAKPAAAASRETKSTSSEPPMQPKVANARAELTPPASPSATVAEWPMEADAQLPARRAPQALASAASDGTREAVAQSSQGQTPAQVATPSISDSSTQANNQANNAASGASADPTAADPQPQAQPVTTQQPAPPPVHVRTAVVRPVSAQQPAASQAAASTFSPFRIALGLLVVVIALAAFMNRHLLQRLGRRSFGVQVEQPPRQRRDIWAPLDADAERPTYEDMVAEPVELAEPPRWVRNVRELAEAREHVERLHARTHEHEPAYYDDLHQTGIEADAVSAQAYDQPAEPRRATADELEDLLRRASQRPASPRRDSAPPRELATPRAVSATRARTSTDRSGARA
ncbi:MAG: hypothetical protein J0G95_14185 [Rhizobiales bacterium]|nr:hypothetical protein [Hyphomicrobiales bacterium]